MAVGYPVYASENAYSKSEIAAETASRTTLEKIAQIPIYITSTEGTTILTDAEKDAISKVIAVSYKEASNRPESGITQCRITRLSAEQKNNLLAMPIFKLFFKRFEKEIESGVKLKYINIYAPSSVLNLVMDSTQSTRANADDVSYWESNCSYLGTYNGYKFLYLESSYAVETSEVIPGNISGSWKWNEIAAKSLKVAMDHYVKGTFYQTVRAAQNGLSTIFELYDAPLSVSYSTSSGYIKAKVSGDVYVRMVLIRDDLDRVAGYAYYDWATTERLAAALRVDMKYPYKQNSSGTWEYRYPSYTFPTQQSTTPGYYGNSSFYSSVIALYNATNGYFTHDEDINIYSAVASMLS